MGLFVTLSIFSYSALAFYIAINNIIIDKTNNVNRRLYNYVLNNTQNAKSIEVATTLKKNDLDILETSCGSVRYQINQTIIPNVTNFYNELYAQNSTCQDNLDYINRTLQEIKSNGTLTVLGDGTCTFVNVSVSYLYKRYTLNGYDFYYYIFSTSDPVFTNSSTVYIETCVPIIFKGPLMNKTYTSGISSVGAVSYLEIGEEKLKIQFVTGLQTIQLIDFQI